jgi:predicted nucleic acid-binding protein
MILVDTNVWSELTRAKPDPAVRLWESANASRLWLATVVIGELLSGAQLLPEGKRRQAFLEGYDELIDVHADRIISFDLVAARLYGGIVARQMRAGRNPGTAEHRDPPTVRPPNGGRPHSSYGSAAHSDPDRIHEGRSSLPAIDGDAKIRACRNTIVAKQRARTRTIG